MPRFELQGHRGARGLKPENTLPAFEVALDVGVTSIETDVHLTRDGVPVLYHDPMISCRHCRLRRGSTSPDPATEPLISSLTLAELRGYRARRNPGRKRFPDQDAYITPVARIVARGRAVEPYTLPTLDDLWSLVDYYWAGGDLLGKTAAQCAHAGRVILDLELKRVPYHPEVIGDDFDGIAPGLLESRVVEAVAGLGRIGRLRVRSFDHRALRALKTIDPEISTAILIAGTAPVDPAGLAKSAGADTYCPDYQFLDEPQVKACHAAGVRVIPWTVNEKADWLRLLDWGVDGITTDYPDRLARLLRRRKIEF